MQIKFIDKHNLTTTIVNVKSGTLDEVLAKASQELEGLDIGTLRQNDNILDFSNYMADIFYKGVPKSEHQKTKKQRDWTRETTLYKEHYKPSLTAKSLSIQSKLPLGQVYYLSSILDLPLTKGKRGRRSTKK